MSWVLWALVGLPLVSGVLLCLGGRRADRVAPAAAVFVAAAGIVLAVTAAYAQPRAGAPLLQGAAFGLAVDGLSGLMVVTVTAVAALILLFSTADVGPDQARARFFGVMLLFVGAMLVTVTATTLPSLLMSWEVMGATSWALIGYWWHDPVRGRAAGVAFITTRTADLGLYLAAGAALAGGQSLALAGLDQVARPWLHLVAGGVIAAALGKSAQLPFSFWLSRAMQGPSPVSALLHSATMVVAGAYLLIRTGPLLSASGWGSDVTAWIGVTTAFALGLVAVAQTDLKQLLAASSCAQIGFMVLAAGTGSAVGGTLQLIAHAAAKSLAFLVTGFWLTRLGTKDLSKLRGAARAAPVAGVAFSVAALSLAGVPPLSLWAAKDVLLAGALAHSPALYAAGLAAAAVSAMYSVRALWYVWRPAPPPRPAPGDPAPGRVSAAEGVPFAVLSAAAVVLTVLVLPPVREAVARTLGVNGEAQPLPWEFVVSGLLALSVAAAVWAWGERPGPVARPAVRWAAGWLGLEAASRFVLVRPVQRLAEELAGFDDRVLDRGVDGLARGTLRLADVVNRRVETAVDGLVEGTAAASRALGRLARRPQTGQLHQYLAQAVAAFTVLAVVLVLMR
ncbi:NADH-quinone oxidoreductase subunit L [Streptomyces sp. PKU-MA01144]|uniref:NADH-quinone oxidoreductase subunit 5 family protein n=1 Tax=Streptomyces sp. PKU-MA01144 TaxID=2729138 RepID=UPI001481C152|nr:proton-conducting transporter membrane subunit [Streptomyces sp. PKU-MA01144]NNJ07089.1 NADH-quinone oxidoreductase subunit L [Streptomyces sp. PKU-MA01144]